eukprot:UN34351
MGTLGIACFLYCSVAVVLLGMIPFQSLDTDAPLAKAFEMHQNQYLQVIVTLGALTTITCTVFSGLVTQPRILYRMSRDGLFFEIFGRVDPHRQTPIAGTIWSCSIALILATFVNF